MSNYCKILETTTEPEQENIAQWLAPTITGLVSVAVAVVIALILIVVSIVEFLIFTHNRSLFHI